MLALVFIADFEYVSATELKDNFLLRKNSAFFSIFYIMDLKKSLPVVTPCLTFSSNFLHCHPLSHWFHPFSISFLHKPIVIMKEIRIKKKKKWKFRKMKRPVTDHLKLENFPIFHICSSIAVLSHWYWN